MSNTSISASKWSILLHHMKQWYHTHDLVLPLPFGSVMTELILSFSESKMQEKSRNIHSYVIRGAILHTRVPTIMLLPIWTCSVATREAKWTKDKFLTREFKLCACHPVKLDRYFSEVIWQAHLPAAYKFPLLVLFGTQSLPSIP